MQGENIEIGMPQRKEDLENAYGSIESAIKERLTDLYEDGIVQDSQLLGEGSPLLITASGVHTITIGTGVKYISGERVLVDTIGVTMAYPNVPGWSGATGADGLNAQSADGLGGYIDTPQSSGTLNIPIPASVGTYRVWIAYLDVTDYTAFSSHKYTGKRIYYKRTDGYDVQVTSDDSQPAGGLTYLKIGEVPVDGSGNITPAGIDQSMATMAVAREHSVGIFVRGATGRPATYTEGEFKLLSDHINAVGTGVVSPTNPHGVVAGVASVEAHNRTAHKDGVISKSVTTLYCTENDLLGMGFQDAVVINQLITDELVILNGVEYTEVYPVIPGDSTHAYVGFGATGATGDYYIILYDNSGALTATQISEADWISGPAYPFLTVGKVNFASNTITVTESHMAQLVYGLVGTDNIQPSSIDSSKLAIAATGSTGQDVTTGNGVKTGHIVDGAVTNIKLAPGAVGTTGIQDACVTAEKLAPGIVYPAAIRWIAQGEAVVTSKVVQTLMSSSATIHNISIYADNVPTGATGLEIDIRIVGASGATGTSIFSTKPIISSGSTPNVTGASGIFITCNDTAYGAPASTPAYGQAIGLIGSTMNTGVTGSRVILDITMVGATYGGGDDLLVTAALT